MVYKLHVSSIHIINLPIYTLVDRCSRSAFLGWISEWGWMEVVTLHRSTQSGKLCQSPWLPTIRNVRFKLFIYKSFSDLSLMCKYRNFIMSSKLYYLWNEGRIIIRVLTKFCEKFAIVYYIITMIKYRQ